MASNTQKVQIKRREALAAQGLKDCGTRAGCGRTLPIADFNKQKGNWDGLKSRCRACTSTADKEYVAATPHLAPLRNARNLEWQKANPETCNAKVRRWQRENPERAADIAKRYRDSVTVPCSIAGCDRRARSFAPGASCSLHERQLRQMSWRRRPRDRTQSGSLQATDLRSDAQPRKASAWQRRGCKPSWPNGSGSSGNALRQP